MSALLDLLDVRAGSAEDTWQGPASGPEGKRSFGGQFMAQSLAAACRTVDAGQAPTNMHLQFLRGGEAGDPVEYTVARVFDGRTAAARRVEARQDGRLLTTATVSFAAPLAGPEHGTYAAPLGDPEALPETGPAGPAPSMPLDEIDIRIDDDRSTGEFVRRLWWRVTVPIPDDPLLHTIIAAYVTDVYMIDPALAGARSLDEGPHPPQWHDGLVDLVPPAGAGRPVEPAGVAVTRGGARAGRDHRQPDRCRRRHRRHPGAGGSDRRTGTAGCE